MGFCYLTDLYFGLGFHICMVWLFPTTLVIYLNVINVDYWCSPITCFLLLLLAVFGLYLWLAVMPDDTSFPSILINSPAAWMFGPKTILVTTVKLNWSNYLLWAQVFHIFIDAQNKLASYWNFHLLLLLLHMRFDFLVTIVWWPSFSTTLRRKLVVVSCSYLLRKRCGNPWTDVRE